MRKSGSLLHIASLPNKYGIGTMGREAYKFVDWLRSAGQSLWQILPLSQTSFGDSPYQSFSIYAGNPYFISLETLEEEGLLKHKEYADINWLTARDFRSIIISVPSGLHSCWLQLYRLLFPTSDSG